MQPTPVKRKISREQRFPEGREKAQQLQRKPGAKPRAATESRPTWPACAPPTAATLAHRPPKKAAGSTQRSKNYKSFSREKLCFRKPGGCDAVPPSPRFILLWHHPPSLLPCAWEGAWQHHGGLRHRGGARQPCRFSSSSHSPNICLMREFLSHVRGLRRCGERGCLQHPQTREKLRRRLRAPRFTDTRPGARVMAACSGAKTLCTGVAACCFLAAAPGLCRTESTKSCCPRASPVCPPRHHDTRRPAGHPCFQPRTAARDAATLIRCLIPPSH